MKASGICFLIFVFVLTGCTTSVTVEGTVPTPLVAKIPANVGIYYSPDFRSFRHEEVIEQRGTFKVDLGNQNLTFFRNLMDAMFDRTVEVGEPPLTPARMQELGINGVVVPEIVKYGFLTPAVSGLNFYSASIHYRISIYDASATKIGDWTLVGYGKAEGGVFAGDNALGEATLLAIRDGGARIAIDLPSEPAVINWIDQVGTADESDDRAGIAQPGDDS